MGEVSNNAVERTAAKSGKERRNIGMLEQGRVVETAAEWGYLTAEIVKRKLILLVSG